MIGTIQFVFDCTAGKESNSERKWKRNNETNRTNQKKLMESDPHVQVSIVRTLELVWNFMWLYLCICSGLSVDSRSTSKASWHNTSTSQGEPNIQAVSHLASHVKYYVIRSGPRLLTQTSVSEYNRFGSGVACITPPFSASMRKFKTELFRFSPKPQWSWNFNFGSRRWWMFPGTNECKNQSASEFEFILTLREFV